MIRRAAIVLAMLLTARPVATQVPTFSSRLEAVRLDVVVTATGRTVEGLGPADFEVRDNGVLQQVDLARFEVLPLDVVLAFDTSRSVDGERLDHLRSGGRAVLGALKPDDRAALITFSHALTWRQPLTGDVQRLRASLDAIEAEGETALVDGAFAAHTLAQTGTGRRLLIVFSDGLDTHSWLPPDRVVASARRSDVTVYGVTVRGSGASPFLEDLADVTGGDILEIESTTDVARAFVRIMEEFRQRYVVSYSPRGVAAGGWHRVEVRLKGRRATVRTRPGYQADP